MDYVLSETLLQNSDHKDAQTGDSESLRLESVNVYKTRSWES